MPSSQQFAIPLPDHWRERSPHFFVIGCGGNGSQMVNQLARINVALKAMGHDGLRVSVVDPDVVEPHNLGRQAFFASDVGQPKAQVVVERVNLTFGTEWNWYKGVFNSNRNGYCDLVITCVDTVSARRSAWNGVKRMNCWWMDLGNDAKKGQIVLGLSENMNFGREPRTKTTVAGQNIKRVPHFFDLFPKMLRAKDDNKPSCSMAEALARQDLFINSTLANMAGHLLWTWFRDGGLNHHGYFVNLSAGRVAPIPVTS